MVEKLFTKRNCKLNITFFQFLSRKLHGSKKIILQSCQKIKESKKMRPAQMKQLDKLVNKVTKIKQDVVKK
jgi:hypothetical protein